MLKCKRIVDEPLEQNFNAPFALLPALEDGYFSDVCIRSANNKEVWILLFYFCLFLFLDCLLRKTGMKKFRWYVLPILNFTFIICIAVVGILSFVRTMNRAFTLPSVIWQRYKFSAIQEYVIFCRSINS